MKVQEVIMRAMARKITWFEAAEIYENRTSSFATNTKIITSNTCDLANDN